MAAATTSIAALVTSVDGGKPLHLEALLDAHRALMLVDPTERVYAGTAKVATLLAASGDEVLHLCNKSWRAG